MLLALNWPQLDDLLEQAGDLAGKIVITCCIPLDEDNSQIQLGTTTSGAEELAKRLPHAHIVRAYNTVPSEVLFGVFANREQTTRPQLVICGDDEQAKRTVWKLVRDTGFEPLDAGGLRVARYTEPFGMLVGELAYSGDRSPALAYRFEALDELNS